jgi:RimJ/RimL family protein N-acetyltransferase
MAIGPTLTTERLILRPPTQDDFPAFAAMMADADHVKFIGGALTPSMAWRQLAAITGSWSLMGFSMFSVLDRQTGAWLGRVGPWMPHGWPGTEVGWGLAPQATGKGYGLEAATAAMDWAFDHLGWTQIIHIIDPNNKPSEALATSLGSTNLGPTRMPEPLHIHTVNAWGQSVQDWRKRRGSIGQ